MSSRAPGSERKQFICPAVGNPVTVVVQYSGAEKTRKRRADHQNACSDYLDTLHTPEIWSLGLMSNLEGGE